jgi:L-aspartate oxidase
MAEAPGGVDDHVFLDATAMGERFYWRFPSITAACRSIGVDPARERIPVAPAAHYACGGVPARLDGTTALAGLFAVGEVSRTGVHGANRLASNSLTESVVSGTRLGRDLAWELPEPAAVDDATSQPSPLVDPAHRVTIRTAMSRHAGVLRDAVGLADAIATLDAITATFAPGEVRPTQSAFEATNVLTVARAVLAAALARTESRGCHRRLDYPEPRAEWVTHLLVGLSSSHERGPVAVVGGPRAPVAAP